MLLGAPGMAAAARLSRAAAGVGGDSRSGGVASIADAVSGNASAPKRRRQSLRNFIAYFQAGDEEVHGGCGIQPIAEKSTRTFPADEPITMSVWFVISEKVAN